MFFTWGISQLFLYGLVVWLGWHFLTKGDGAASNAEDKRTRSVLDFEDRIRQARAYAATEGAKSGGKDATSAAEVLQTRWRLPASLASELDVLLELVMRDFVREPLAAIVDDDEVFVAVRELLLGAMGDISNRLLNTNIIMFLLDQCASALCQHLKWFAALEADASARHPRSWRTPYAELGEAEACERRRYVLASFRRKRHLHPALMARGADGQLRYLRHISDLVLQHVLLPEDHKCSTLRLLAREIMAGSVLLPAIQLITPRLINANFVRLVASAEEEKANHAPGDDLNRCCMHGPSDDTAWRWCNQSLGRSDAEEVLSNFATGAFLLRVKHMQPSSLLKGVLALSFVDRARVLHVPIFLEVTAAGTDTFRAPKHVPQPSLSTLLASLPYLSHGIVVSEASLGGAVPELVPWAKSDSTPTQLTSMATQEIESNADDNSVQQQLASNDEGRSSVSNPESSHINPTETSITKMDEAPRNSEVFFDTESNGRVGESNDAGRSDRGVEYSGSTAQFVTAFSVQQSDKREHLVLDVQSALDGIVTEFVADPNATLVWGTPAVKHLIRAIESVLKFGLHSDSYWSFVRNIRNVLPTAAMIVDLIDDAERDFTTLMSEKNSVDRKDDTVEEWGPGRAWLFMTLNHNLLAEHIETLFLNSKDTTHMNYYGENSLFHDVKQRQVFFALLAGLNGVNFSLDLEPYWKRVRGVKKKNGILQHLSRQLTGLLPDSRSISTSSTVSTLSRSTPTSPEIRRSNSQGIGSEVRSVLSEGDTDSTSNARDNTLPKRSDEKNDDERAQGNIGSQRDSSTVRGALKGILPNRGLLGMYDNSTKGSILGGINVSMEISKNPAKWAAARHSRLRHSDPKPARSDLSENSIVNERKHNKSKGRHRTSNLRHSFESERNMKTKARIKKLSAEIVGHEISVSEGFDPKPHIEYTIKCFSLTQIGNSTIENEWMVSRRYNMFHAFHSLIRTKFPNTNLQLPKRRGFTLFSKFDPAFIESRKNELREYLAKVVDEPGVCESRELKLFLEIGKAKTESLSLQRSSCVEIHDKEGRGKLDLHQKLEKSATNLTQVKETTIDKPKIVQHVNNEISTTSMESAVPASESYDDEIPILHHGNIARAEVQIFGLIEELFQIRQMGALRRNFVTVARSIVRLSFGGRLFRWINFVGDTKLRRADQLSLAVETLRDVLWPDCIWSNTVAAPTDEELLAEEANDSALREEAKESLKRFLRT